MHPKKKLTKYVKTKLVVYWTEETINKLNKPPCNKKCNCNWKKNHTAISQFNAY